MECPETKTYEGPTQGACHFLKLTAPDHVAWNVLKWTALT